MIERDFLQFTSSWRFVLLRTFLVALVVVVAIVLLADASSSAWRGNRLARDFFGTTAGATLAFAILLGPVFAAPAIASERSTDTLALVLTAPVRPGAFVLAKFLSRFAALFVPLLGALPVSAAALLFGGLPPTALLAHVWVLVLVCAFTTAAGILASAYAGTVARAVLGALALALLLPIAELCVLGLVLVEGMGLGSTAFQSAAAHNPIIGIGLCYDNWRFPTDPLVPPTVTTLLFTGIALGLSARRMGREFAVGGRRERTRAPLALRFEDPFLARAFPRSLLVPSGWGGWGGVLIAAAALSIPVFVDWNEGTVAFGLCAPAMLALIVVTVLASQGIAAERQTGSFALVRASPLRTEDIAFAAWAGALARTFPLLVPSIALAAVAAADGVIGVLSVTGWALGTAAALALYSAFAFWISARSRTGGGAVLASVGWIVGAHVVWFLALFLVAAGLGFRGPAEELALGMTFFTAPAAIIGLTALPMDGIHLDSESAMVMLASVASVACSLVLARTFFRAGRAALTADD